MIYNVLWLNIIPGNREKGLAHLQKLAQIARDDYGLSSRVLLGVTTGPIYQTALVTAHGNMASMVNTNDALVQSENFRAWFGESTDLFGWATAEWQTFRALRSAEALFSNFIQVISIHIIPGKLAAAREQMGKLADHIESTYGRPVHILNLEGGLFYRHYWVVGYDNMEQYEAMETALQSDERYAQWTVDMMGMFDNTTIERNIGRYL